MPSDAQLKVMNAVHKVVLKLSFGKLGGSLLGMPAFELTTKGRKSGEPRSVMLTAPLEEGDDLVIVASKGGNDEHPAWFLNLQAHPEVTVTFPGQDPRPMTATIADAHRAGADTFVAGTAVFGQPDPAEAVRALIRAAGSAT